MKGIDTHPPVENTRPFQAAKDAKVEPESEQVDNQKLYLQQPILCSQLLARNSNQTSTLASLSSLKQLNMLKVFFV